MTRSCDSPATPTVQIQRALLALLAATLLLTGFTGNAGVQVLDQDLAVRLARLHLHGVAGEAEYVRANAAPAPFIHPHCHGPVPELATQPSPDEVQAAGALAGLTACTSLAPLPVPPPATVGTLTGTIAPPSSQALPPLLQPPRT